MFVRRPPLVLREGIEPIEHHGPMWRAAVLPLLVLGFAIWAGYAIAHQATAPGDLQPLVYMWLVPIALVAALLGTSGFVGRDHDEDPRGAPTQALAVGVALAVGTIVGLVGTPLLGLTYQAEPVFHAAGPANLDLADPIDFQVSVTATAECRSTVDRDATAQVRIADVGELQGGPMTVLVVPDPTGGGNDSIALELAGTGDATGRTILWHGSTSIQLREFDGRSGSATFVGLVGEDESLRVGPGNSPAPIDPYPATLSGTVTWTCGEWQVGGQAR